MNADFEVYVDDEFMAGASGPREEALREALHYAFQYTAEGVVTLYEVTRTKVALHELATLAATTLPTNEHDCVAAERELDELRGKLLEISGAESTDEALDIFSRERAANVGLAAQSERLKGGLQWYADGNHFELPDWDLEEGWACPPNDESWMVEPGTVAQSILDGHSMNPDKEADEITVATPPEK